MLAWLKVESWSFPNCLFFFAPASVFLCFLSRKFLMLLALRDAIIQTSPHRTIQKHIPELKNNDFFSKTSHNKLKHLKDSFFSALQYVSFPKWMARTDYKSFKTSTSRCRITRQRQKKTNLTYGGAQNRIKKSAGCPIFTVLPPIKSDILKEYVEIREDNGFYWIFCWRHVELNVARYFFVNFSTGKCIQNFHYVTLINF